jgi:hypothetical protein
MGSNRIMRDRHCCVSHRRPPTLPDEGMLIPIVIANPAKLGEAIHQRAQCLLVDCFDRFAASQ